MSAEKMSRNELRAMCIAVLESNAIEHPAGHQGTLAARYVLRCASGERIGLMFEKGTKAQPHLWVERRFADKLPDAGIAWKEYPALALYQPNATGGKISYGRHAALKSMRDLANADLVRFTPDSVGQMQMIVDHLIAF